MELRTFQHQALEAILHAYNSDKSSAIVVMPAGSGKTILSIHVLNKLQEKNHLLSAAYISTSTIMQSQYKHLIDKSFSSTKNAEVQFYTYSDLANSIAEGRIIKDKFQFLIFDAIDEFAVRDKNSQEKIKMIFNYFSGFKLGFSRALPTNNSIFQNFGQNIIFKYSLMDAIEEGTFTGLQKTLYDDLLDNLENAIDTVAMKEKLLSSSLMNDFRNTINILKKENKEYQEALENFVSGKINLSEINEMAYRKEQLNEFDKLLHNQSYFDEKVKNERGGDEAVWQRYFENNLWIFGFGLNYIFNTPLDGKKLEQAVSGYSVKEHGKRIDALLKTTGLIQTLCFGEIKTHRKKILKSIETPYRPESWAISDELAGGIAQVHKTIQKSLYNISESLYVTDEKGFKGQNPIYLYKPKSFLLIGSLNEFKNDNGLINQEKFSSFELFRRSISDIEIITFDELYARADAIINNRKQ